MTPCSKGPGICWYACEISNFVNDLPPAILVNKSSIFGIGYLSSLDAWFTVSLKSPQIRIDVLSDFKTETIGVAQSAN